MKLATFFFLFISSFVFAQRSDFSAIDFKKADSIADQYSGESLKNLPILAYNLTDNLTTDVEKFRAIYTWVNTNIKYDYNAYLKTRRKRKKLSGNREALLAWNNSFTPQVFDDLLKYKKTVCTGYAYILSELANLAGIQCKIINGYGKSASSFLDESSIPNHSWNAVELNNKWYLCDPTWSAGKIILKDEGPIFEGDYYDGYFLAEPNLFIMNHFPLEKNWALLSETPNFKTFLEGPVIYKETFGSNITSITPIQMYLETIKNEQVSFTFTSTNSIKNETIFLILNTSYSSKNIQPTITKKQSEYILQHTFKQLGKYDVHIKVDDAIIATYVIKVIRK